MSHLPHSSVAASPLRPTLGYGAIAFAATLWAIAAIVASYLFDAGIRPTELTTARTVIAAIGLAMVYPQQVRRSRWLDWRILGLGASLALVTITYYVAIERLSVAIAVVIQYTAPTLVVLFTAIKTRRFPSTATFLAATTALAGVTLITGVGNSDLALDAIGVTAAALSAFCFASYSLFSEALVGQYGATGTMFRGFTISGLIWLGIQLTQGVPAALLYLDVLPGILFIGIGGTLVPFSLLCWGIQQVQADRGTIAATLEPVMSAILAWIILGQALSIAQLIGGALVIGAVTLLQIRQVKSS